MEFEKGKKKQEELQASSCGRARCTFLDSCLDTEENLKRMKELKKERDDKLKAVQKEVGAAHRILVAANGCAC